MQIYFLHISIILDSKILFDSVVHAFNQYAISWSCLDTKLFISFKHTRSVTYQTLGKLECE